MLSARVWRGWTIVRTSRVQYRAYAATPAPSPLKVQYQPAPHSGNIRILLLDRPEARNALSRSLVAELRRHVDDIHAEGPTGSTRALILASNTDKAFCAGADLRERKGMSQSECVSSQTVLGGSLTIKQDQRVSDELEKHLHRPLESPDPYHHSHLVCCARWGP